MGNEAEMFVPVPCLPCFPWFNFLMKERVASLHFAPSLTSFPVSADW